MELGGLQVYGGWTGPCALSQKLSREEGLELCPGEPGHRAELADSAGGATTATQVGLVEGKTEVQHTSPRTLGCAGGSESSQ